jgi:polyhydroxyalkanoate synthesis regulator protein
MLNAPPGSEASVKPAPPVVVKKYANRRLYNTESSSYITLETQIIVEEESKGRALLPTGFLRQLIGFYGDSMQGLVPRYLESAMTAFGRQQDQLRATMQKTVGNLFPGMEEMGRQNLAMVERAMSLFTPFYRPGWPEDAPAGEEAATAAPSDPLTDEVHALKAEIAALRSQLEQAKSLAEPPPQQDAE